MIKLSKHPAPTLRINRPYILKRAVFFIWAVFLFLTFRPTPTHIVYADPITAPNYADSIKPLESLKDPSYTPQTSLESLLHQLMPHGTYPNAFAPGNCTWGVASRLPVTWSGNAADWAANAALQGYQVSTVPKVGAIAASSTVYYLGHVGIVTSLDNGVTMWEENYNGLYSVDERQINVADYLYIYF